MLKAGGVKTNRLISSSAVGAGFACPKTQNKLFSGEQASPLRTKRQHYPHFDTLPCFFIKPIVCFHLSGKLIYNLLSHITAAEISYSWAFGVKVVFLVTILF